MHVDVEKARERLVSLRNDILTDSARSEADRAPVSLDQQSVGRLSRMDAMQQQAMAKASERARSRERLRVDAALQRIEDGEYGFCIECGSEIPFERLRIDPAASHCVACAGRQR